jgi:hypothetical protein
MADTGYQPFVDHMGNCPVDPFAISQASGLWPWASGPRTAP